MTKAEAEKLGGKLHKIMNHALYRKLALKEYSKVIEIMSRVFHEAQKHL